MSLIKSKQRIADHGEVFTPNWMVEAMLDLGGRRGQPCVHASTRQAHKRTVDPSLPLAGWGSHEADGEGAPGATMSKSRSRDRDGAGARR
jgi:hypothetical protein